MKRNLDNINGIILKWNYRCYNHMWNLTLCDWNILRFWSKFYFFKKMKRYISGQDVESASVSLPVPSPDTGTSCSFWMKSTNLWKKIRTYLHDFAPSMREYLWTGEDKKASYQQEEKNCLSQRAFKKQKVSGNFRAGDLRICSTFFSVCLGCPFFGRLWIRDYSS